ncbi:MAG TPA: cyclophane-containing peptide 2OG-Fe(II) oxygenase YhhC [Candidatus Acidoferrales bacterium]|nr:cyclophane-containing peptide 2OG-Fe(II) oxygenase YhhC [Candidatus Acidoferrales bacterium]
MNPLDLSGAVSHRYPFPCFTVVQVVSDELEQALLAWFESEAPWRLATMDFYEQYEFDFRDVSLPLDLAPLFSEGTLFDLRRNVGTLLGASLKPKIDITAHRLKKSQRIRIHNDARPDGETHRFLIQLNRGWSELNGGLLMLFRGPAVDTLEDVITPKSRSAFGFEISAASYHAVSQVYEGDRYTLVFSFYADRS